MLSHGILKYEVVYRFFKIVPIRDQKVEAIDNDTIS